MNDFCSPHALCDIAQKDTPRLQIDRAHKLIQNPFVSCLQGGYTQEARRKALPGKGPRIFVKKGYSAFKEGYIAAHDALNHVIVKTISADIQFNLFCHSRKANLVGANSEDTVYTRGPKFHHEIPTRGIRWDDVKKAAEMLEGGKFLDGTTVRVIDGPEVTCELLHGRRTRVTSPSHHLLQRRSYEWEIDLDSNIGFGFTNPGAAWPENRDQLLGVRSLRAQGFYPSGYLNVLSDTKIMQDGDHKTVVIADDWMSASLGILFVVGPKAISRKVINTDNIPVELAGCPHLYAGFLDWHYVADYVADSDLNIWGDYAWHRYEIERNYVVDPDQVVAILYRREIIERKEVCEAKFV